MANGFPDPFFEVRVSSIELPELSALCAGFDSGNWRAAPLADHLFQWIPFAALNQEHQFSFGASNFVEMLKLASAHIYKSRKTATRGELGELMLHLACILHFGTIPVLCKLILKTSSNDTAKGFDGVHVLCKGDDFEIWLGESKFYQDPKDAIREAVESVKLHLLPAFLDTEKAMIFGHIADGIPHKDAVTKLFKQQASKDQLMQRAVFPVLIAYNSGAVAAHGSVTAAYEAALKAEAEALRTFFTEEAAGIVVRFKLIFVPMNDKAALVTSFDKMLGAFL